MRFLRPVLCSAAKSGRADLVETIIDRQNEWQYIRKPTTEH